MWSTIKELYQYRELLVTFVKRDVQVRYKGSILGFFWSFLLPVASVAVLYYIATFVMDSKSKSVTAYLAASYLPFTFFNQSLLDGAQSVLGNINILRKVYIPREVFTVSIVISNFIHLLLGLGVLQLYLFLVWARTGFHQSPYSSHFWLVPILLVIIFCLAMGLSLLFAALNVFYEDIRYLLGIALWMFFFANPVFYFEETIYHKFLSLGSRGELYYRIWAANPVAVLCSSFRIALVAPGEVGVATPTGIKMVPMFGLSWTHIGYAAIVSFAMLWIGNTVFQRMKWKFVERP